MGGRGGGWARRGGGVGAGVEVVVAGIEFLLKKNFFLTFTNTLPSDFIFFLT